MLIRICVVPSSTNMRYGTNTLESKNPYIFLCEHLLGVWRTTQRSYTRVGSYLQVSVSIISVCVPSNNFISVDGERSILYTLSYLYIPLLHRVSWLSTSFCSSLTMSSLCDLTKRECVRVLIGAITSMLQFKVIFDFSCWRRRLWRLFIRCYHVGTLLDYKQTIYFEIVAKCIEPCTHLIHIHMTVMLN